MPQPRRYRPLPRSPFLAPSWPQHSWHHADVQSVGGGLVLADDDTLRIYASSRSGLPHTGLHHSPGGNRTMGYATLRRDGFASVVDSGECTKTINPANHYVIATPARGMLLTRPVVFDSALTELFVNVEIAYGGFLSVELVEGGPLADRADIISGYVASDSVPWPPSMIYLTWHTCMYL